MSPPPVSAVARQPQYNLPQMPTLPLYNDPDSQDLMASTIDFSAATRASAPIVNVPSNSPTPAATTEGSSGDGHIGAGKIVSNLAKGCLNFFKGMVCDENGFSIKRTLITAVFIVGGVALCLLSGGAAAPLLIAAGASAGTASAVATTAGVATCALTAAGAAMGGFQATKGAINVYNAKTDAEDEKAWQEIGCGATAVGGALLGAKGALKVAGKTVPEGNMLTSSVKSLGECFKITGKSAKTAATELKNNPLETMSKTGDYVSESGTKLKETFSSEKVRTNLVERETAPLKEQITKLNKEKQALEKDLTPIKEQADETEEFEALNAHKEKITKIDNEIKALTEKQAEIAKLAERSITKDQLTEAEKAVTDKKTEIEAAKKAKANTKQLEADLETLEADLALKQKVYNIDIQAREAELAQLRKETGGVPTETQSKEIAKLESEIKSARIRIFMRTTYDASRPYIIPAVAATGAWQQM